MSDTGPVGQHEVTLAEQIEAVQRRIGYLDDVLTGAPSLAERIQRKRTRGWRMPEDATYVGRPSNWGNPYAERFNGTDPALLVALYRDFLTAGEGRAEWVLGNIHRLRGRRLACWCRLDQPCHADVLLEFANRIEADGSADAR